MRKFIVCMVGLLLISLVGCKNEPLVSVIEDECQIYCLDAEEQSVVGESYVIEATFHEDILHEFLRELQTTRKEDYVPAIPETVTLPEVWLSNNGLVTLRFDDSYSTVTGVREVLMRAAIVKTLCQTEGVDAVEFYVDGQPLMGPSNNPIGIMKEEDFIDNTGEDVSHFQYIYATVYYSNMNGDKLVPSNLRIPFRGFETEEEVIITQLFAGPLEKDMLPVVSRKVRLNSVTMKDGICTVDVNASFLDGTKECTDEVTLYALVNTMAERQGVLGVQILIDGKVTKQALSTDIEKPLERNLNIVEAD